MREVIQLLLKKLTAFYKTVALSSRDFILNIEMKKIAILLFRFHICKPAAVDVEFVVCVIFDNPFENQLI